MTTWSEDAGVAKAVKILKKRKYGKKRAAIEACCKSNPTWSYTAIARFVGCEPSYASRVLSGRTIAEKIGGGDAALNEYAGIMLDCKELCDRLRLDFRQTVGGLVKAWNAEHVREAAGREDAEGDTSIV
jgi:hypothetical protein